MSLTINTLTSFPPVTSLMQGNILSSKLGFLHIDLSQEDPYTLETLGTLMEERSAAGLDFFICGIREKGRDFFFNAVSVLEAWRRSNGHVTNPLTREKIDDFEIFIFSQKKKAFESYAMKEEIVEFPHYLPLFWNDHRRSDKVRGIAFDNIGYAFEHGLRSVKQDTNQAIHYYEQAARLGCVRAMGALISLHLNAEQPQKALAWVKPFLESCNSPEELTIYAHKMHQISREDAFLLLQKGALMGNYFAIANVIVFYEEGYGVKIDLDQASYWRQKIPPEWQDKTMLAFIRFLKQSSYDHNTGEPTAKKRKLNTSSVGASS